MKMRSVAAAAATTGLALALAACSTGSDADSEAGSSATGNAEGGDVSGDITFLTNRTDLVQDGTFDSYIEEFQKVHPDVEVNVEGITNYEDDVRTRMSTPNGYGDVLLIPTTVPSGEFATFFEPLGSVEELDDTYRFQAPASFDGVQYGIALGGNANGVLYNTEVFEEAGISELPTSPEDFIAALEEVEANTDAVGLYTNYADGWPLGGQYFNVVGAPTGNPTALSDMAHDESPWMEGKDVYVVDSLLYDVVAAGLNEDDPLTTNWEQSKGDFATGKIGTMVLGSWAIAQFQAAAEDAGADPSVVGFMAFPATAPDGTQYATIGGDYNLAINVNSESKDAARAWMDFLLEDSGFTESQGMISALKSADLPENLSSLATNNVELLELAPAPVGEEGLLDSVADASQVDVWGNLYRQKLVDVARGQGSGDKEAFFADLNANWSQAVQEFAS